MSFAPVTLDDTDCLPHDKAVWRTELLPPPLIENCRVSLHYPNGLILCDMGQVANWHGCTRWRFGWPPRKDR